LGYTIINQEKAAHFRAAFLLGIHNLRSKGKPLIWFFSIPIAQQ